MFSPDRPGEKSQFSSVAARDQRYRRAPGQATPQIRPEGLTDRLAEVSASSMQRERVFVAVASERRALASLIENLDGAQLATPSLCAGWDVKTVAAHLVSDFEDGFWGFLASGLRHGSMYRGIDALARRRSEASATDIANTLRNRAEHRLSPPVTGPRSGLTDVLVHGADIRIPLEITHRPDPEHVAWVLDFLTGRTQLGFLPRGRLSGIALVDEDTGRSWGTGDALVGPGEALMLAACGRTVAFDRLTGPAVAVLRARLD